MFDDYRYKNTSIRINFKFRQERDEPMYPWEIASFLNKLNTVYYKFELLNSICSAINNGISPEDIFIFDHSLPLYERYTSMNLLGDNQAAKVFYPIGLPIPITPTLRSYDFSLFYQAFRTINSFLRKNHIQPLSTNNVAIAYNELKSNGLDKAEDLIVELATLKAKKSYDSALLRGEEKTWIGSENIESCLTKYRKKKQSLLTDLLILDDIDEASKFEIIKGKNREDKRLRSLLLAFFRNFDHISRPLVCARVSHDRFRVLGRSLVNKTEQTGLELKEISKNSPLTSLLEGGVSIYQAIKQEERAKELHEIEKEIKYTELECAKQKLRGETLKNIALELQISERLNAAIIGSDVEAIKQVPNSFVRQELITAYCAEENSAGKVLNRHGLVLDRESITIINTRA